MKVDQYLNPINLEINKILKETICSSCEDIYDELAIFMQGGKRIRPIAAILAFNSIQGNTKDIVRPAVGIEFLHNSTLCHDDITDEDKLRRNRPSFHESSRLKFLENNVDIKYNGDLFTHYSDRFGTSMGMLAGNILNYLGYKALLESDFSDEVKIEAVNFMNTIMIEINNGQIMDLKFETQQSVTEEEYLSLVKRKTAMLLGSSLRLGAIFAGASEKIKEDMTELGINVGIAFQVIDDLMDINQEMNKGNSFGSDIRNGKKTLLTIYALEHGNEEDVKTFKKILAQDKCTDGDIQMAVRIIEKSGAKDYVKQVAATRTQKAEEIASKLNMPDLQKFAQLLLHRTK